MLKIICYDFSLLQLTKTIIKNPVNKCNNNCNHSIKQRLHLIRMRDAIKAIKIRIKLNLDFKRNNNNKIECKSDKICKMC